MRKFASVFLQIETFVLFFNQFSITNKKSKITKNQRDLRVLKPFRVCVFNREVIFDIHSFQHEASFEIYRS